MHNTSYSTFPFLRFENANDFSAAQGQVEQEREKRESDKDKRTPFQARLSACLNFLIINILVLWGVWLEVG